MGERRRQKRAAARRAQETGVSNSTPQAKPVILSKTEKRRILLRKARRRVTTAWSVLSVFLTLLALYVLRPDISIEPYATTDPTRPFDQQFSIQNNSVYSIHDVVPVCGLHNIDTPTVRIRGIGLAMGNEVIAVLEPGVKTTLTCGLDTVPQQQEMVIEPWVQYKIPFGITRCKAAIFKGKAAVGGTYIWTYDGSGTCRTHR